MDKKLFEELMEACQQMVDHASGKKVEGVREVTYDDAHFRVGKTQFDETVSALDKPVRNIPMLRELLTQPGVFDEK